MVQITEAIYTQGILKPVEALGLQEQQRVRLIVEPIEMFSPVERAQALEQLRKGIREMNFRSTGPLPSREDLHDRG